MNVYYYQSKMNPNESEQNTPPEYVYSQPPPPHTTKQTEYTQPDYAQQQQQYAQPIYTTYNTTPYGVSMVQSDYEHAQEQEHEHELINDWGYNMCDCLDDFPICLNGLCCGGFVTSTTKAKMETREPEMSDHCLGCILCMLTYGFGFWCCQSLVEYSNRREIEKIFNMKERENENNKDMLLSCCCMPCVVCQHTRELKDRQKRGEFNFVKM